MFLFLSLLLSLVSVFPAQASESTGYIFVGDSRTVGVSQAVDKDENVFFVAEVGKGYDWFCETALNEVDSIIDNNAKDNWVIVSSLGVNDLSNVEKYKLKYKELCEGNWKDYDFYIVSVTCIDESKYKGTVTNDAILEFNRQMRYYKNFIDIFDISRQEIVTKDGLHYTSDVYAELYDEVMCCLE